MRNCAILFNQQNLSSCIQIHDKTLNNNFLILSSVIVVSKKNSLTIFFLKILHQMPILSECT